MMHSLQSRMKQNMASDFNLGAAHKGRPHGEGGVGPMRTDAVGLVHADVRKLALILHLVHSANTVFTQLAYN